jgi:hypothetical protein
MSRNRNAARRANAIDLVMQFNNAQSNTNADIDGLSSEERLKRATMAQAIKEADEDAARDAAAAKRQEEVSLGIDRHMDAIRAADQSHDEQLAKRWRHSIADIRKMIDSIGGHAYYFRLHDLPFVDGETFSKITFDDVRDIFHAFLAKKEAEGVTIDGDESKEKLALFVAVMAAEFLGKDTGINLNDEAFEKALYTLERWNAIKVKRTQKPQATPELAITLYSDSATDKEVVERDLHRAVIAPGGLCDQWLTSLAENFSFCPNESQWRNAIALMEHRQLPLTDPKSFDICRTSCVRQHLWPEKSPSGKYLLTVDERIEDLTERYVLSDPQQRRAFFAERNRILFDTE